MNFEHAFIITYGRSGSTLLQGILNTIPGAEIRGENGNLLFFVYKTFEALKVNRRYARAATTPTHPWFGANQIPHEDYHAQMLENFKRDIMPPRDKHTLTGFKEIRFHLPYVQIAGYVSYLREFFPRCAVIFNTRALDAVIESNRRANHSVIEEELREADANFRRLASEHPDFCYHVHYDDYVADPEILSGLFDFLGAPLDADRLSETLSRTHSVRTRVPPYAEPRKL